MSGYRVAKLAALAGVTVRTLHHYDEIGLLQPSQRSSSGHRLYADADLLRLQQILTLRHMGFSLEEIQALLGAPAYDLTNALKVQKDAINAEIERLQEVSQALEQTLTAVSTLQDPPPSVISAILRGLSVPPDARAAWLQRFYSGAAAERLQALHGDLSPQALAEGVQDWADLSAAFHAVRDLPPHHPQVQPLAARMDALIRAFTQDDPHLEAALRRVYTEQDGLPAQYRLTDPALLEFMQSAWEHYRAT